jgi:DNA-binding PadR family transcriptional regulator
LFTKTATPDDLDALVRKYRRNLINTQLEHLILGYLEQQSLCGYDIISIVHDRFHVLLSPGQVYPVINYLVDHGLVAKEGGRRRVLLCLTHSGQELLRAWRNELSSIQLQLRYQGSIRENVAVSSWARWLSMATWVQYRIRSKWLDGNLPFVVLTLLAEAPLGRWEILDSSYRRFGITPNEKELEKLINSFISLGLLRLLRGRGEPRLRIGKAGLRLLRRYEEMYRAVGHE